MIKTGFDARVKVQQIIDNQLPEFVLSEAPKAAEFLKQYYISQEYQGGPIDIAENLDQYINFNNMTQDVVAGITSLTSAISASDTTIAVDNTKRELNHNQLSFGEDMYEVLKSSNALILCTEWSEFRSPNFDKMQSIMKDKIIFDGKNIYDTKVLNSFGFKHFQIGVKE